MHFCPCLDLCLRQHDLFFHTSVLLTDIKKVVNNVFQWLENEFQESDPSDRTIVEMGFHHMYLNSWMKNESQSYWNE